MYRKNTTHQMDSVYRTVLSVVGQVHKVWLTQGFFRWPHHLGRQVTGTGVITLLPGYLRWHMLEVAVWPNTFPWAPDIWAGELLEEPCRIQHHPLSPNKHWACPTLLPFIGSSYRPIRKWQKKKQGLCFIRIYVVTCHGHLYITGIYV